MVTIIKIYDADRTTHVGTMELSGDGERGFVGRHAPLTGEAGALRLFSGEDVGARVGAWLTEYGAEPEQVARVLGELRAAGGGRKTQQELNAAWRERMRARGHKEIRRWVPDTARTLGVLDVLADRLRETYENDRPTHDQMLDEIARLCHAPKWAG